MLEEGNKVEVIKTRLVGTVKEIKSNHFSNPILVQFGNGWDYYKESDLRLVEENPIIKLNDEGERKMKELIIPVKFQKGDTIYTTKQVKEEKVCHICEGNKTITYKDKDIRCPECMGQGKITSNKQVTIVLDDPFDIKSMKINVSGLTNKAVIKYRGSCGNQQLNRSEDNLFATKEEAQARCNELNKEKIYVNIDDIVIQELFSQPSIEKITERLNYYKEYGKFEKDIVINKEKILLDGYITYLLCKLLNINTVRTIVEDRVVNVE
jgi:hypothetical protein